MVPQTLIYRSRPAHSSWANKLIFTLEAIAKRLTPRPHAVSSIGLLLSGLGIPFLMLLGLLPATLFLGFVGLSLIVAGGLLVLSYI